MVKPAPYVPARGDLVWVETAPRVEGAGPTRRLAMVVSPVAYNRKVGLALVCPVTRHVRGYPFAVLLPPVSSVPGAVLSDQVRSLDWKGRRARRVGRAPRRVVSEVLAKAAVLLA